MLDAVVASVSSNGIGQVLVINIIKIKNMLGYSSTDNSMLDAFVASAGNKGIGQVRVLEMETLKGGLRC
jgi:hypothetical protein